MTKNFNLAVIAGDGIGPEVVAEGIKVLDAVAKKYGATFTKTPYDLGAGYWHKTGEVLPDSHLQLSNQLISLLFVKVQKVLTLAQVEFLQKEQMLKLRRRKALIPVAVPNE